jgi:3-oxoacyl-ACP reductase-like protein
MSNETHEVLLDPSHNVRSIVERATAHLTDLANAESRRVDGALAFEIKRIDEKIRLQSEGSVLLNVAEAKRIDAIRAVDVNAVSVANEKATAQAVVLANQVAASAETLRALVAATAATQAQQLATLTTQLTDRLSSLEKSQYENKGSGNGMSQMYGWIFSGLMGILTIALGIYVATHH